MLDTSDRLFLKLFLKKGEKVGIFRDAKPRCVIYLVAQAFSIISHIFGGVGPSHVEQTSRQKAHVTVRSGKSLRRKVRFEEGSGQGIVRRLGESRLARGQGERRVRRPGLRQVGSLRA